jgi:hypothetical protein
MSGWVSATPGFVKKPDASFSIVNECLEEARGRHVIVLVAEIVSLAKRRDHALVVLA